MGKTLQTPEKIIDALNKAMAESNAIGGDCRKCQVKRIGCVTKQEAKQLGRNWNVEIVNGECSGDCMEVLKQIAIEIGNQLNVDWS